MDRVLVAWSGGKDSTMALHEILAGGRYDIAALLTTVTDGYDRISMHGVRRGLLERQAESLGMRLEQVIIPMHATDAEYEARMAATLKKYKAAGVTAVVFGDIFLEDLRQYRERNLARLGLEGLFPLWKRDTASLMRSFIGSGFRAVSVCVDNHSLGREFVGRSIDGRFISELPEAVDVCGENGEYHTFVSDGPIFGRRIAFRPGEIVLREERFYYCDLLPD